MVTATFFCLGLALCIFAGLVCLALAKSAKAVRNVQLQPHGKASWDDIKRALLDLHSRYESIETTRQRALRSWAGTLVICAGLCMIGILLEVQYNRFVSVQSVVSGLTGETHVAAQPLAQSYGQPSRHNN